MSKQKLSIWILGFVTLIICSFLYFRSSRFEITEEKGNISYKIDKWTGETWVLSGDNEIKVENNDEESSKKITKTAAIEEVKNAWTLDINSNEFEIQSELKKLKGSLNILGWEAKK